MKALLSWAIQPIGMISLMLLLTLLLSAWQVRWARMFVSLSSTIVLFWFLSAPATTNLLVNYFENSRVNPSACDAQWASLPIVVLGGGIDPYVLSTSPYEILNNDSLLRVHQAIELATDKSYFYLLGFGSDRRNLAETMATVLRRYGIQDARIIREKLSRSTVENAAALAKILPVAQTRTIALITSALHIPRAAATFEKVGYTVCHVAADTLYSVPALPDSLLPHLSGLIKSTATLHEVVAWSLYKIKNLI